MKKKPTEYVVKMAKLRVICKKKRIEVAMTAQDLCVYSPQGYRFTGTGSHVLCSPHRGVQEWKLKAIDDITDDLKYGLERCPKTCECKG